MTNPAIADVADTIALWIKTGIVAVDAWQELTGERRRFVTWAQVEDFMIGWSQGYCQPADDRQGILRLVAA